MCCRLLGRNSWRKLYANLFRFSTAKQREQVMTRAEIQLFCKPLVLNMAILMEKKNYLDAQKKRKNASIIIKHTCG